MVRLSLFVYRNVHCRLCSKHFVSWNIRTTILRKLANFQLIRRLILIYFITNGWMENMFYRHKLRVSISMLIDFCCNSAKMLVIIIRNMVNSLNWIHIPIYDPRIISISVTILEDYDVKNKYATSHFNSYNSRRYNALQKYKTLIGLKMMAPNHLNFF